MSGSRDEEKRSLRRAFSDGRSGAEDGSIHSLASSPTLTPSPFSPALEDDKGFPLLSPSCPGFGKNIPLFAAKQTRPQTRSWLQTPLAPKGITILMLRILYFLLVPLLPSPLQALLPADPAKPRILRKIHPTSYLDGLRGVAALIVLQSHFLTNWFYPLRSGYLNTESDTHLLQLPILRLLYAGRASVAVFFVVSGFVLSYKPLLLARSSNQGAVLQTLSSSVFRRGFRLWIPIVFGTFISALLAYNDLYTPVPNRGELIPPVFPTLREQLWHWWGDLCIFWFPWKATVDGNDTVGFAYNGHLWTIPIEFYGSIVVFVTVLGLSGVNRGHGWMRIAIGTGLVGWSLRGGRWDAALFLGGMVCAEWSLMVADGMEGKLPGHVLRDYDFEIEMECSLPGSQALHALLRISKKALTALRLHLHPFIRLLKALKDLSLVILLFTSLFLLSYAGESASPGYYHNFLIPYTPSIWESVALGHEHFWLCIGALLLLFTLTNSPTMQRPFTWALPQYLGDVSYSLYIVHGMVLFTLGTGLQEKWTGAVGKIEWVDNGAGELVEVVVSLEAGARVWWRSLVGCVVVNWVVIFWCADLFWRAVDGRVPGWGRSVEGLVSGRRRGRGR